MGVTAGSGVGVATVTLGSGEGVGGVPVQTVKRLSIPSDTLALVTPGGSNVGTAVPPRMIVAVPESDTNTMFEFAAVAVANVHGELQNVVVGTATVASIGHGPVETFPRWSKR